MTARLPRYARLPGAILLLLGLQLLAGCQPDVADLQAYRGETMGTYFAIQWSAPAGENAQIQTSIDRLLREVNRSMSTYLPDSELSRFNRLPAGESMPISSDLREVMRDAFEVAELTGGAFDFTVGSLVNLWGFGPDGNRRSPPDDRRIDEAMKETGYRFINLEQQGTRLHKQRNTYVDLSAIAKGYAVDRIAVYLASQGIADYLVDIGGELRAAGQKAGGVPWRVGIEKPDDQARTLKRIIELGDIAVATSGDYRNYFEQGGVRYSHTIDPATGRPVSHALASVTVLAERCERADALATALMVMGPEKGRRFAEQQRLAAYFIIKEGAGFSEQWTEEFAPYLAE